MGIEVHVLRIIVHLYQRTGGTYLRGIAVFLPFAVLPVIRTGRVHGSYRVEKILRIVDTVVLEGRAEHAEVTLQTVIKGLLLHVYLCHKVAVALVAYDAAVAYEAERSTIVGLRIAAAEGEVVVLQDACTGNGLVEIGIAPLVVVILSPLPYSSGILGGTEHLQTLVHGLQAETAVVGDLESLARTLLCLDLNNARCTTRPVLGCLGGILQYGETLDVGRIDGSKSRHIARYAVDDDQRVVAAHDGGGTAHPHRVEHGDAV